jgi:hypothetical protein
VKQLGNFLKGQTYTYHPALPGYKKSKFVSTRRLAQEGLLVIDPKWNNPCVHQQVNKQIVVCITVEGHPTRKRGDLLMHATWATLKVESLSKTRRECLLYNPIYVRLLMPFAAVCDQKIQMEKSKQSTWMEWGRIALLREGSPVLPGEGRETEKEGTVSAGRVHWLRERAFLFQFPLKPTLLHGRVGPGGSTQ